MPCRSHDRRHIFTNTFLFPESTVPHNRSYSVDTTSCFIDGQGSYMFSPPVAQPDGDDDSLADYIYIHKKVWSSSTICSGTLDSIVEMNTGQKSGSCITEGVISNKGSIAVINAGSTVPDAALPVMTNSQTCYQQMYSVYDSNSIWAVSYTDALGTLLGRDLCHGRFRAFSCFSSDPTHSFSHHISFHFLPLANSCL